MESSICFVYTKDSNGLKSGFCVFFSQLVGTWFSSGLQKNEYASPEVSLCSGDGSHCHSESQGAEGHPHSAEDSQASGVSCWKSCISNPGAVVLSELHIIICGALKIPMPRLCLMPISSEFWGWEPVSFLKSPSEPSFSWGGVTVQLACSEGSTANAFKKENPQVITIDSKIWEPGP